MFLSRKTVRLASFKNKIANQSPEVSRNRLQTTISLPKPEAESSRYPLFNYFIGVILIGLFIYFLYSVNGGSQSIPGFNSREWWQYLITLIPLILAVLMFALSSIETVSITKDKIEFSKHDLLGFRKWESKQRDIADLMGISIIKRGIERVTMNTSCYFLVFNFRPFEEIDALECASEITAVSRLQELKVAVPHLKSLHGRISIKNIVQT